MSDFQLNQGEQQAIQSLLEMENASEQADQIYDWNNAQKSQRKSKKSSLAYNFVQVNKKLNPEQLEQTNFINKQRLLNLNRFRRTRSLFDPMKIFKMGTKQLVYEQSSSPQSFHDVKGKKTIHKHPQQIRDLNFKTGHPSKSILFKRDDTNFANFKNKSSEFVNGESVIIQVQSYEETFNKKEVEYLMNKTMGARNFKSHLGFQKKQDPFSVSLFQIKSQDMKLKKENNDELIQINKNGNQSKITSKMRFTAYLNKKAAERDQTYKMFQNHSSLDLKNLKQDQMTMSLRMLLNNLKHKNFEQFNHKKKQSLFQKNSKNQKALGKIFDKDVVFKNYEQEEFRNIRKPRANWTTADKNQDKKSIESPKFEKNQKSVNRDKSTDLTSTKISSKRSIENEGNEYMRILSPKKYYQKSAKKQVDERDLKIFNIKKLT